MGKIGLGEEMKAKAKCRGKVGEKTGRRKVSVERRKEEGRTKGEWGDQRGVETYMLV